MTDWRRTALAVVFVAGFVLVVGSVSHAEDAVAPDFTLPNLAGEDVTLSELLKEGPVIVDFWATWCKPCIKAFPDLQKVFDNYRDCGLRVLAVSIDGPRSSSKVGSLIKSKGNTFEVLLDPSQKVAKKLHVTSVPRTVLINTDGKITYAVTGYRPTNHEKLEAAVRALFPEGCEKEPEGEEEAGE
ncbi:MAG: TlpA disulfide reductase family protein [Candidatus Eisenbacteria bacterium]